MRCNEILNARWYTFSLVLVVREGRLLEIHHEVAHLEERGKMSLGSVLEESSFCKWTFNLLRILKSSWELWRWWRLFSNDYEL